MANQFLSLSLFIMLLAFFIILSAVSNFEEMKSQPVLESLALTFSDKQIEPELLPNTEESEVESTKEGSTLDKIEGLFSSQIAGAEVSQNRLGTVMHARMPFSEFKKVIDQISLTSFASDPYLDETEGFLATLISLTQSSDIGVPYRMDVVLNTRQTPEQIARQNPTLLNTNTKKMALLSDKMRVSGMPRKMMSIGMMKGTPDMVDIYFRRYEPFSPVSGGSGG